MSEEEIVTLGEGEFVAKFTDNNVLASSSAGYELSNVDGTDLIGSNWKENPDKGNWRNVAVTNKYAKSGTNSLMFNARNQHDIYTDIKNLETNTYYIVSFYWMLPKSVITDTVTAGDGYYGSAIGTSANITDSEAQKKVLPVMFTVVRLTVGFAELTVVV